MDAAFEVHKLNEEGLGRARHIALAFNELLLELKKLCGEGRELAIVRTKLEEACFFAKKAMANDPANQSTN